MKTHRFYIKDMGLEKDIIVNKKACPELYNQVVNVLRLQKAEHVKLFRESLDYVYEIKDITHDELTLILKDKIENRVDAALKSKSQVNLYIANIKKDKIEWCVEKATELGVASINLISTERAQKLNTQINSNKNNLNRLEKIIIEATEQCGRGELVKINESQKLEKAIQSIAESGRENINYVCVIPRQKEAGSGLSPLTKTPPAPLLKRGAQSQPEVLDNINIFIGPEGGWTDVEEDLFVKSNFNILNLGPTTLRSETAAVCAVSKFA